MKNYNNWLKNFGKCWKKKDFSTLKALLSNNIHYYENPHEKPLNNKKSIIKQWENDLKNQEGISFSFKILSKDKEMCIANWEASFTINKEKYIYDGIYHIKLNENNECIYFKQWSVRR